jgi:hypothetical protein
MRFMMMLTTLFLVNSFLVDSAVVCSQEKTALEIDSTGWMDLFPDKDLSRWKRVALDQGLSEKSPWKVDGDVLICEGAGGPGAPKTNAAGVITGAKEMLLYDQPFENGIFHVEFRFQPLEGMHDYNSGAYVRSLDGKIWHQVQIAHLTIPPYMGDLFHMIPSHGKTERIVFAGTAAPHVKPPGEWNTIEISAKKKEIQVHMNGHHTLTWQDCSVPKGMVGMQSEFYNIEFRNIKYRPEDGK